MTREPVRMHAEDLARIEHAIEKSSVSYAVGTLCLVLFSPFWLVAGFWLLAALLWGVCSGIAWLWQEPEFTWLAGIAAAVGVYRLTSRATRVKELP